jgi:hypothetical protein
MLWQRPLLITWLPVPNKFAMHAHRARRSLKRAMTRALAELDRAGLPLTTELMPVPHMSGEAEASSACRCPDPFLTDSMCAPDSHACMHVLEEQGGRMLTGKDNGGSGSSSPHSPACNEGAAGLACTPSPAHVPSQTAAAQATAADGAADACESPSEEDCAALTRPEQSIANSSRTVSDEQEAAAPPVQGMGIDAGDKERAPVVSVAGKLDRPVTLGAADATCSFEICADGTSDGKSVLSAPEVLGAQQP